MSCVHTHIHTYTLDHRHADPVNMLATIKMIYADTFLTDILG